MTVFLQHNRVKLALHTLREHFKVASLDGFGLKDRPAAIGAAGGLTDYASKRNIWLIRANGTKIKVNYRKAIANPALDPQVFPGDSINVEKSIW